MSYSDLKVLTKIAGDILAFKATGRSQPLKYLIPDLVNMLLSWIPDKMDDVCSFIQDLVANEGLSSIVKTIILEIIKVTLAK
jgi:hypothetical protein